MQLFKKISLSLLLSASVISSDFHGQVNGQVNATGIGYPETPAKTVCIKHPAANNPATFFSTGTVFSFEIYKAGDVEKIVNSIKSDADVASCSKGIVTGDYQQIALVLKTTKDKKWFADLFKKAGLNTIKINNNPIVEVDKM